MHNFPYPVITNPGYNEQIWPVRYDRVLLYISNWFNLFVRTSLWWINFNHFFDKVFFHPYIFSTNCISNRYSQVISLKIMITYFLIHFLLDIFNWPILSILKLLWFNNYRIYLLKCTCFSNIFWLFCSYRVFKGF